MIAIRAASDTALYLNCSASDVAVAAFRAVEALPIYHAMACMPQHHPAKTPSSEASEDTRIPRTPASFSVNSCSTPGAQQQSWPEVPAWPGTAPETAQDTSWRPTLRAPSASSSGASTPNDRKKGKRGPLRARPRASTSMGDHFDNASIAVTDGCPADDVHEAFNTSQCLGQYVPLASVASTGLVTSSTCDHFDIASSAATEDVHDIQEHEHTTRHCSAREHVDMPDAADTPTERHRPLQPVADMPEVEKSQNAIGHNSAREHDDIREQQNAIDDIREPQNAIGHSSAPEHHIREQQNAIGQQCTRTCGQASS